MIEVGKDHLIMIDMIQDQKFNHNQLKKEDDQDHLIEVEKDLLIMIEVGKDRPIMIAMIQDRIIVKNQDHREDRLIVKLESIITNNDNKKNTHSLHILLKFV